MTRRADRPAVASGKRRQAEIVERLRSSGFGWLDVLAIGFHDLGGQRCNGAEEAAISERVFLLLPE